MRALLLVALLGSATAARADDGAAAAKQHYDEGTKAYDLGRYLEAAKEYETAFRIKDAPELLFNIAQAYRLADDHRRAMRSYRAYLRRLPSASNRAEVEAKIGELQKLIEQEESAKQGPPEGTIAPSAKPPANAPPPNGAPSTAAPSTAAPSNAALRIAGAPARPAAAPKPVYQRAWFWGAVGGAIVAVALGVGLGVGLSQPSTTYPAAQTTLGTVKF